MINVAILEDKTFLTDRFSTVLSNWDYIKGTSVFHSGRDFQKALLQFFYDVLLVDLDFSEECILEVLRLIGKLHPKTAVIAISDKSDPDSVVNCIRAGASGYLLKSDSTFGVKSAISEVLNRGAPLSPSVAMHLLNRVQVSNAAESWAVDRQAAFSLTKRECDVINLLSKELSTRQVGLELGMSEKTVPVHLRNIYKKLGTSSRKEAIIKARHLGLVN